MTNAEESKSADKPLPDDIPSLEAEVAMLTLEQEKTAAAVRRLMEDEDPDKGIYHAQEIFHLQQEKLRLGVEIKFRTNKINRIKLGMEEGAGVSQGVKNGFLF